MNELYWEADLVLGSFGVGQLDTVAIEAMRKTSNTRNKKEIFPNCPLTDIESTDYEITNKLNNLLNSKTKFQDN